MQSEIARMKTELREGLDGVVMRPEFDTAQQTTQQELSKLRVGIFGVSATAGMAAAPAPDPRGRKPAAAAAAAQPADAAADALKVRPARTGPLNSRPGTCPHPARRCAYCRFPVPNRGCVRTQEATRRAGGSGREYRPHRAPPLITPSLSLSLSLVLSLPPPLSHSSPPSLPPSLQPPFLETRADRPPCT
jgi:hypothetical protein